MPITPKGGPYSTPKLSKPYHRFQNMGRGVSDACLTESVNGQLIQQSCQDLSSQLWIVLDGTANQFGSPF